MKRYLIILFALIWALPVMATPYAGEIFRLAPGVSNQAMGSTGLNNPSLVSAGWWNPALLAFHSQNGIELMRSEHFEGLLNQNQLSVVLSGKIRTAINLSYLSIDKIKLTQLENPADSLSNDNRPVVWKTVSNHDFILSASFARALGDKMALGITPKLAYRDLAGNSGYGFGADLGFYLTGEKGISLGANLRDFFGTQIIWENGSHEIAIPSLDLEASWQMKFFRGTVPAQIALRTEFFAENRGEASLLDMGYVTADLHAGIMVQPIPSLIIMSGYDADAFTAGLGLRFKVIGLDYAFKAKATDGLGSTQKLSLSYAW